jgi:hypothetical protein
MGRRLDDASLVSPATDDQQLDIQQLGIVLAAYLHEEGVQIHVHQARRHSVT